MDLSVFFDPIALDLSELSEEDLGRHAFIHLDTFPAWQDADVVIVGCDKHKDTPKEEKGAAPAVRSQLYRLSPITPSFNLVDLGNLVFRTDEEAYWDALAYVLEVLLQAGKVVVLLGRSQEITWPQYQAYQGLEEPIEYVQVDSRFDMKDASLWLDSRNYNHRIFHSESNHLFNFTNLGYQRYFVRESSLEWLSSNNYFAVRYGNLTGQIEEVEPYIRTAHMMSMDVSAIRFAEMPGSVAASPGGFSASEACRIARYAGISSQMSSISFSEYDPRKDAEGQGSMLIAMMVWYFLEGVAGRQPGGIIPRKGRLRRYAVQLNASITSIDFFQDTLSGRWWMEVPYPSDIGKKRARKRMIACSEKDYLLAKHDDIPERWWLTFNKLT